MGVPWRAITAASLAFAYFATSRRTVLGFLGSYLTAWLIQFTSWVFWVVVLYPKYFSPLRNLPQPSNNAWFMGQWYRVMDEGPGVPQLDWINSVPHNGLIRWLGLFNQERIFPASPQALKEVFVTKNYDFTKPAEFTSSLGRFLGIGLFLAEGEVHKHQRHLLLPAFAFRHIKELVPVFWDTSREGVEIMTDYVLKLAANTTSNNAEKLAPKTGVFEISEWTHRMTLDIICLTGLGRDFGATKNPTNPLATAYHSLFRPDPQTQILGLLRLFLPGWFVNNLPVKFNSTVDDSARKVRDVCRDLIAEKKQKLANKTLDDLDILSVALESGGFTDENLVDQMMTFLAAGHETTASAMTWTVYMLCLHPEVQERLRQEVRSRLPSLNDPAGTVSAMDLDRMPYLNAVCNESLRYYPPVPISVRVAAVDTTVCDTRIPKGTRIMLVPWAVNRSHAMWGPDADKFNPDRWLPYFEGDKGAASGHATSNYAFMTFFHGPRSCIGQGYAKAEFAALLACWVGRFKFELKNEAEMDERNMKIKGLLTARPANGLWVKVTVLDGW
ncbi:cytochrome P450 4A12A [Coniochaeta sp. 2T2.1]|nr:cytochrome P450 4A12A [Coniochaeta sp. 2T2.1]